MSFTTSRLRSQLLDRQVAAAVASGMEDLYCQASLPLAGNRSADALKRLDEAHAHGHVPPELLVDRAVALTALDRAEDAIEICRAALSARRLFVPAHLSWGESLVAPGRYDEALEQYGAALKADAHCALARAKRATLLMVRSRAAETLVDLQCLVREFANDTLLHNRHGLALKYVPEWRWLLHRSDSVWYPTARLFRQQTAGGWSAPFAAMETDLTKLLAAQDQP